MPLKQFVWLNRFIIKVTHFPLLFVIYIYEKYWLAPFMYEPTDLVEHPGTARGRAISFADPATRTAIFSPNIRVREESVVGFQKDRALEEVFRRVPDASILRNQRRQERRKTQTAIRNWMDQHDDLGSLAKKWPTLDGRRERPDWHRRYSMNREIPRRYRQVSDIRSAASDPADLISNSGFPMTAFPQPGSRLQPIHVDFKDHTDADGDDELVTNDEEEEEDNATNTIGSRRGGMQTGPDEEEDYFTTPVATRFTTVASSSVGSDTRPSASASPRTIQSRRGIHSRTLSTNTILYNPKDHAAMSSSASGSPEAAQTRPRPLGGRQLGSETPTASGYKSPRRNLYMVSRPRPILTNREMAQTAPTKSNPVSIENRIRPDPARRLSSIDMSILSDNSNIMPGLEDPTGGLSSSFQTQMVMALTKDGHLGGMGRGADPADRDRMGRLVLARMKTLEEGLADVVKEMRELRTSTAPTTRRNSSAEDVRGLGMTTIEVAGRDRQRRGKGEAQLQKRASVKRPTSRRSTKEQKGVLIKDKGKGKEVARSSDEDDADIEKNFTKGSSF
jgi:hypothetical protein